ncbi:MAG: peptidase domain-containing ABC transporter [Agitococcus sp.]|nr:peptidase domain-containing ABC transporter [Agitococcus sp.]
MSVPFSLNTSLLPKRAVPVILQREATECGLACLAMLAGYFGYDIDLLILRQKYPASSRGMTLADIGVVGEKLGLSMRALKGEIADLPEVTLPALMHWNMNHFVVLVKLDKGRAFIHDPGAGPRWVEAAEFSTSFTGIVAEFTPTEKFEIKKEKAHFSIFSLMKGTPGYGRTLAKLILLSVVLEGVAIVSPMYLQTMVDTVVPTADKEFLVTLAMGFGLLACIEGTLGLLKGWLTMHLSAVLSINMKTKLFRHLVALPLSFFEKRHMGDIMTRFLSANTIRDMLADGVASALIDGVMGLIMLGVMLFYAPTLALISVATTVLTVIITVFTFRAFKDANRARIDADIKESSLFLETIRGIQALKLFGRERERVGVWQAAMGNSINKSVVISRLNLWRIQGLTFISHLENVLVVAFGAWLAIKGELSVGMLFAFYSYKTQFASRVGSFIQNLMSFKLLSVHSDNLADIALSDVEMQEGKPWVDSKDSQHARVEFKDVAFQYNESAPMLFTNFNLIVEPGEIVALTGPSGCGKSTLVKLVLGVLEPTAGQILINGQDLALMAPSTYRRHIATVMQDDVLFSGSMLDNITLLDPHPELERAMECAQRAGIGADIEAMPMGYYSMVGESLQALSGGQKQRLFIARALYKRASVLLMDEATSHLDKAKEIEISEAVRKLGLTTLIVAHRQETLASADRVIHMGHPGGEDASLVSAPPLRQ